ncbi:MAG: hypothetical protein IBJ09_14370 [Bacteroidia bacterium]|nr:hypothetical protein [Bacteroidia bacterium]
MNLYILRKKRFSNILIEKQEVVIDISGDGSSAGFYQKVIFRRLSRTGTACFRNHVTVDGIIEPLSHFNCSYVLNASRDQITLFYRDQAGKDRYGMVKRTGKFLIFSAVLKNAFVQETEFWDLVPLHYCKDYNLQITLPAGTILKSAGVYKVDATGKETELENIPVIKMRQDSRDKMIVSIADYFYTETFRVRWEIS